jgi:membrane protease YdiL (CAAX protease family)
MSMIATTLDLPHASSVPAPMVPNTEPRPWGFWATLGLGLFATLAGLIAMIAFTVIWMLTHQLRVPDAENAIYDHLASIVGWVTAIVVLVIAIALKKCRQRDYFGFRAVSRSDLLLGLVCLAGLTAVETAADAWLGLGDGSFMESFYRDAKLGGALPLLWINLVIVAPVTEELVFRGFLHRGWATSRLGVVGTVILTSLMWALLHQQYSWVGIFFIFCSGLLFGWLRQRSGTTLTIGLHALGNLLCVVLTVVELEWLRP